MGAGAMVPVAFETGSATGATGPGAGTGGIGASAARSASVETDTVSAGRGRVLRQIHGCAGAVGEVRDQEAEVGGATGAAPEMPAWCDSRTVSVLESGR